MASRKADRPTGRRTGAAVAEWPAPAALFTGSPRQESSHGQPQLSARYGINEENLAQRRQFVRLSEQERELLAELAPWAR